MTIAGRNGAGKTTLLRMLSGETSIDGGELVLAKGTRVALHDQRPPRERDLSPARLRPLGLRASRSSSRPSSRRLEHAMAAGDEQAMDALRRRRRRASRPSAATAGASARARSSTASASPTTTSTARCGRSPAASSRARSLARALAAQPDLLLLDEPTNHLDIESLEWLEQTLLDLDAAIVLVAHDRWFLETVGTAVLELEAGRARFFNGTWHALAHASRPRASWRSARAIEKQQAEIARMERFVERFRYKATKARQAQDRAEEARQDRAHRARPARRARARRSQFKKPERSGRVIFELEDAPPAGRRRSAAGPAGRRRAVARARRARLARRAQRHRQDDAHRGARRASASSTAAGCAPATTSRSATSASTPRSSRAAARARCSRPPSSAPA